MIKQGAFSRLRILGASKNKELVGPENISINLNANCNINCLFCARHSALLSGPSNMSSMSLATIKRIIDFAVLSNVEQITLTSLGEPTIRPDVLEIMDYIKVRRINVSMMTNATFSSDILAAVSRIDDIAINLCAPDKHSFDKLQAPGSSKYFERISRNLKVLSSFRFKNRLRAPRVSYVIFKQNYRLIPQMMEFLDNIGNCEILFKYVYPVKGLEHLMLSAVDKKRLREIIARCSSASYHIRHNLFELTAGLINSDGQRFSSCFTGWLNLYITPHGFVSLCCMNRKLIIGNVNKDPLEKLWYGIKAHQLRLYCKEKFSLKDRLFKSCCEYCPSSSSNMEMLRSIRNLNKAVH